MTSREMHELVKLNGRCAYNTENKTKFRRLAMKLLRELNKRLNLNGDVRYNPAGIAVSGDATLHAENVYITFSADRICDLGILYRTCKGKRDYTGGRNHFHPIEALTVTGLEGLARRVAAIIPHWHECPKCGDDISCNDFRCAIPEQRKTTCAQCAQ